MNIVKVPKLRFRGFNKEWQEKRIGEIITVKSGQGFKASEYSDKEGVRLLQIENVKYGTINWDNYVEMPKEYLQKYPDLHLKKGDIILALNRPVTNGQLKIAILKDADSPSILYQRVGKLTALENVNSIFIYYLCLIYIKTHVLRQSVGSDQPFISLKSLYRDRAFLPEKEEQEKIAGFLTTVDDKISGLEKKKELLEKYKKGVMQKIFPPVGGQAPQIRFKGFSSKREETSLGEVGKTYNGLQGKTAEDFGEGQPYITYSQIFADSILNITNFGKVKILANEKQNVAQKGDVFFTTSSETPEEVGYSSVLVDEIEPLYLNSFCFGYRINDQKKLLPEFARFLFRSQGFRKKVVRLAQGSTRYNLSKIEFMKTTVDLPEFEEQKRVADFLTVLDDRIELQNKKLQQAKKFKKALLQSMFV